MKFWEAMKALEEGKKVRLVSWIGKDAHVCKETMADCLHDLHINKIELYLSSEWELYEEPHNLLNFAQVLQGMKEGKRFTRKRFEEPMIYQKSRYGDFPSCIYGGELHTLSFQDFEATDWIEVKE